MQQFTVLYCQWVVVNLHCNERAFLCLSIYIVLFNIKFKSFKLKSSWVMLFCMHRHLFLVKKIYLDTIFFLPETSACGCMIFVHYVVVFFFFFCSINSIQIFYWIKCINLITQYPMGFVQRGDYHYSFYYMSLIIFLLTTIVETFFHNKNNMKFDLILK